MVQKFVARTEAFLFYFELEYGKEHWIEEKEDQESK